MSQTINYRVRQESKPEAPRGSASKHTTNIINKNDKCIHNGDRAAAVYPKWMDTVATSGYSYHLCATASPRNNRIDMLRHLVGYGGFVYQTPYTGSMNILQYARKSK